MLCLSFLLVPVEMDIIRIPPLCSEMSNGMYENWRSGLVAEKRWLL